MSGASLPAGLQAVGEPRPGWCGVWWRAVASSGAQRGALRLETPDAEAAGRVAAAVRAVNALDYSGFLGTGEPIRHDGALWLVTGQPASPTLIELAERRIGGVDIGGVATIVNETAQSLAELHANGLSHGCVHGQTVVVTSIGAAKLAETALLPALRPGDADAAAAATAATADRQAWAELVRGMVAEWGAGHPASELLQRVAALGEHDLAQAVQELHANAVMLPSGFAKRAGLVAAVAAYERGLRQPEQPAPQPRADAHHTMIARSAPAAGAAAQRTTGLARVPTQSGAAAPALPEQAGTRLARRPGAAPPARAGAGGRQPADQEVRFGPGVSTGSPVPPAWRGASTQRRRRRRRSPWRVVSSILSALLTVVLLAAVGWYLWQRVFPIEVNGVSVSVPSPPGNACDVTIDVVAVVETNGNAGVIKYRWLRSGAEPGGVLTEKVARGQKTARLHLEWAFSGQGSAKETATIDVLEPSAHQAKTPVAYNCRR
jgi:hypothetical protein